MSPILLFSSDEVQDSVCVDVLEDEEEGAEGRGCNGSTEGVLSKGRGGAADEQALISNPRELIADKSRTGMLQESSAQGGPIIAKFSARSTSFLSWRIASEGTESQRRVSVLSPRPAAAICARMTALCRLIAAVTHFPPAYSLEVGCVALSVLASAPVTLTISVQLESDCISPVLNAAASPIDGSDLLRVLYVTRKTSSLTMRSVRRRPWVRSTNLL